MYICSGSNCSKREQCANYIANNKKDGTYQYVDLSRIGYGNNTNRKTHYYCGDLSDKYPKFQEMTYEKPDNLQEIKEFIYDSLKKQYGSHVISNRKSKDIVIDTKTKYFGNSDVWISLEYFH